MNAIVLAAGLGTRLRPLTLETPKPALVVKGKPIIRYVLDWLEDAGFGDILIKLYYLSDIIIEAVGDDRNVEFIVEGELRPTAEFLKRYQNKLEESFLVTNGDTLTNLNLLEFIEFHLINKNIATVFTKHDAIYTGGTYIFDKEILKYIKKGDNIPDLMKRLNELDIPINLYFNKAKYFDTATIEKLEIARKNFEK